MSTKNFGFRALVGAFALLLSIATPLQAASLKLKPFKDELFAYPGILEKRDNGDWLKIDYNRDRDIFDRDEIPVDKVKGRYVSLWVRLKQDYETLKLNGREIDLFRTGAKSHQTFTVIFVHGRGVDRKLGGNDFRFGGNFNRLKNLAAKNGGTYYAPTIKSFDSEGVKDMAALIAHARKSSPGNPIVLACASMGSFICSGIARDPIAAAMLRGMVILGGAPDPEFIGTPAYDFKIPLVLSHGSWDYVYDYKDQDAIYQKLHSRGYPVRYILFETGKHGIPMRMTDWREVLNWIFAKKG